MPVYVVTGKLGAGKTLAMVGRIRDYLKRGRPVATNIELHLEKLLPKPKGVVASTTPVYRLSDRPTVADLDAIGSCHDTGDEALNGALVLDECGAWLNARQWADKERQAVIDWLLHSRKKGWDVYLIVQGLNMLDKQLREAICEFTVVCRRMDRMRVPLVGWLINKATFGLLSGNFPRIHVAFCYYGLPHVGVPVVDRWMYQARDLYGAYETVQVIGSHLADGPHAMIDPRTFAQARKAHEARARLKPKRPEVAAAMALPDRARVQVLRRVWATP